jgi:predicted  nucleic acid-binding Zn-ribbon protein
MIFLINSAVEKGISMPGFGGEDFKKTKQHLEKISVGVDRMQSAMNDIKTQIDLITTDIYNFYQQRVSEQSEKSEFIP